MYASVYALHSHVTGFLLWMLFGRIFTLHLFQNHEDVVVDENIHSYMWLMTMETTTKTTTTTKKTSLKTLATLVDKL